MSRDLDEINRRLDLLEKRLGIRLVRARPTDNSDQSDELSEVLHRLDLLEARFRRYWRST